MFPYLTDTLSALLILAVTSRADAHDAAISATTSRVDVHDAAISATISRVDVHDATIASSAATTVALGERLNDQGDEIQDLKSGMFHFHQLQLFVTSLLRQLSNTEMIIK